MSKTEWFEKIKAATEAAETYKPFFDLAIEQLAQIMETKDAAVEQYEASGGLPVLDYTNAGGHTNPRKNPALAVIQECNTQALAYWRELGLTVKAYKAIGRDLEESGENAFEKILGGILG